MICELGDGADEAEATDAEAPTLGRSGGVAGVGLELEVAASIGGALFEPLRPSATSASFVFRLLCFPLNRSFRFDSVIIGGVIVGTG